MTNLDSCVKKQRHYFADKGPNSQGYGLFGSHIWMWELDNKETWASKNWCFWTVVLEKTRESPLESKEVKPDNLNGNQPWILFGRTGAEVEIPILWPPDANSWLIGKDSDAGKDWRQKEKRATEDEMVGWHYQFNWHELGQILGDGEGIQVYCSLWGSKELDTTWWPDNNNVSTLFFKSIIAKAPHWCIMWDMGLHCTYFFYKSKTFLKNKVN